MWIEGKVIERINWNEKLFSLKIKVDIQPFIAGQFIKLSQVIDDKRVGRAYSIVNAPDKDFVEILAVSVTEGQLSPNLQQLNVGDTIDVSPKASGFMTLDEIPLGKRESSQLWMISTGTAVGPFISILETEEPWSRFEKIILVYGVRKIEDLAYRERLVELKKRYPTQFELILSVTREVLPEALTCRISDGLISGAIEELAGINISAEHSQVMLCGNPDMIADTNKILLTMGLSKNLRRSPGQITMEKYW